MDPVPKVKVRVLADAKLSVKNNYQDTRTPNSSANFLSICNWDL